MIKFTGNKEEIQTINGEHSCLCVLHEFNGEITSIDKECTYLTFMLFGNCTIRSDISLVNQNNLDTIIIKGDGNLYVNSLKATTIEVYADVTANTISGNVVKFSECNVQDTVVNSLDAFIQASGHMWAIDCHLDIRSHFVGISSPYILIDNSSCWIEVSKQAFETSNNTIIEHCNVYENNDQQFVCTALVRDDHGTPHSFQYAILRDESGKVVQVATRRELYGYDVETLSEVWDNAVVSGEQIIPAQPATIYDEFKHSTQYTNVDLHRWITKVGETLKGRGGNYITDDIINQICTALWSGEASDWEAIPVEVVNQICEVILPEYIYDGHAHSSTPITSDAVTDIMNETHAWPRLNGYELDEVDSRKYEVGMYSLYSYRTTDLQFYEQNNEISEDRELP